MTNLAYGPLYQHANDQFHTESIRLARSMAPGERNFQGGPENSIGVHAFVLISCNVAPSWGTLPHNITDKHIPSAHTSTYFKNKKDCRHVFN